MIRRERLTSDREAWSSAETGDAEHPDEDQGHAQNPPDKQRCASRAIAQVPDVFGTRHGMAP